MKGFVLLLIYNFAELFILIKTKKNLYEILEVKPTADLKEIRQAYQSRIQSLEKKQKIIGIEEAQVQRKSLDMAYSTLANPVSRDSYDAKLSGPNIKSAEPKIEVNVAVDGSKQSTLRRVLTVIAGVMVIWLVMQMAYMVIFYRNNNNQIKPALDASSKAAEQLKIQEYYQMTGVRASSGAEVDLLMAAERKKSIVDSEQERIKRDQDREYQQWLSEGERISDELDRQREHAERQAQLEREREMEMQEQEKRMKAERERKLINDRRMRLGLPPVPLD